MFFIGLLIAAEPVGDDHRSLFRLMLKTLSSVLIVREICHLPISVSPGPRFLGHGPHTKV